MAKRLLNLRVEKMVYGGYGLARKGRKIFLVEGAYPDEEVRVSIKREKRDVTFCKVEKIEKASPFRVEVKCDRYSVCGGCDWMGIAYEKQLEYKRDIFIEQMRRIAKIEIRNVEILPTSSYHYRNKVEYAVEKGKLGFFKKKSHDIVKVKKCAIVSKKLNMLKSNIEKVLKEHPRFSSKLDKVILRTNGKEEMAVFVSNVSIFPPDIKAEHVVSVRKDSVKIHEGSGELIFEVSDVKYQVPALSFFQVNLEGAEILAETVKNWVDSGKNALDLYCGVGLFSLQISEKFDYVKGIESFLPSVNAARENALLNEKTNVEFDERPVENLHIEEHYDVVIMDPPRSGLDKKAVEAVIAASPLRIIYVSCDSSTFARDVRLFTKNGFLLKKVKLVDMFPQTHHFETIGLLKKS